VARAAGAVVGAGGRVSDSRSRFVDGRGFAWQIREVRPPARTSRGRSAREGGGRASWLYFFSRFGTKRLADYPPNWSELPSLELERLFRTATTLAVSAIVDEPAERAE
jgi:hypothetical protein